MDVIKSPPLAGGCAGRVLPLPSVNHTGCAESLGATSAVHGGFGFFVTCIVMSAGGPVRAAGFQCSLHFFSTANLIFVSPCRLDFIPEEIPMRGFCGFVPCLMSGLKLFSITSFNLADS